MMPWVITAFLAVVAMEFQKNSKFPKKMELTEERGTQLDEYKLSGQSFF